VHFIEHLLNVHDRKGEALETPTLRGYKTETWAPAEYQHAGIALSVSQIAYSPCPTYRDLFFEKVEGIPRPMTWPRIVGAAIDQTYKLIHDKALKYCETTSARNFALLDYFSKHASEWSGQIRDAIQKQVEELESKPSSKEQQRLATCLSKIMRFEIGTISGLVERELARMPSLSPRQIFNQHFDFQTDFQIDSIKHGFTSPATPDFFYHNRVLGDIKSGQWEPYYAYTMVAYALAFEEEQKRDVDLAAILVVSCPPSRPVPSYHKSRIEFLDDRHRKRFLAIRDRKLQIVAEGRDPGRAARQEDCDPNCPYWSRCWDDPAGG
jgi:CRISPR/Cas system-associated exonuclease Cas4 (RecB family)